MLACSCHDNWGMLWKPGRAGKLCVHEPPLAMWFLYSWAAKHFSVAFCKPQIHHLIIVSSFQGREGEGHSRRGKQVGMTSRFFDELSFWRKEWLPHTHTHTHRVTCFFVPCITISLRSGWWEDHKAHQNSSRAVPLCLQSHRIPESARLENTSKTESNLCPIPSLPEQRAGHLQGWALHSCPNI